MVYGRYNELVNRVYKLTNITGGPHPVWIYSIYLGYDPPWLTSTNQPRRFFRGYDQHIWDVWDALRNSWFTQL